MSETETPPVAVAVGRLKHVTSERVAVIVRQNKGSLRIKWEDTGEEETVPFVMFQGLDWVVAEVKDV